MDALLTPEGWWTRGPEGYAGPHPAPPPGRPPHRVAVVETPAWRLAGPAEEAEPEAARQAGPEALLVLEPLDAGQTQAFACAAALADRAAAWEGVELIAPYALAVRAALAAAGPAPAGPRLVLERCGALALLTVLEGPAVLAARWVRVAPEALETEVRRTVDSLAGPGPTELLAPAEALAALAGLAPALRPLPAPGLGLAGLPRLPAEAGFVAPAVQLRRLARAQRARARRRALLAATAALSGALLAALALGLRWEAGRQQASLEARQSALRARIEALAPRALGPRVAPRPLDAVARLAAALPEDVGLKELALEPAGPAGWRLTLTLEPAEEALREPAALALAVRAAAGPAARTATIAPTLVGTATLWQVTLTLPGDGGRP